MVQKYKTTLKRYLMLGIIIISALLIAVIFSKFNFTELFFASRNTINYIYPTNCPENVCNINELKTFTDNFGMDIKLYQSNSVTLPLAFILNGNSAIFLNTLDNKTLSNDLCVLLNYTKSCDFFSNAIEKTDKVDLNFFTSLFYLNDVRLKSIAIKLKQELGDRLNVFPRFIIASNLDDPTIQSNNEIEEIERQMCLVKEQPNTWVDYVNCIDTSLLQNTWRADSWRTCAESSNVDVNMLNNCITMNGSTMIKNEFNKVKQLGIKTSPVLFINNDIYTSQLTYDAIKKTVCMYFKEKPKGC